MATSIFAARRALRDLLVTALPDVTVAYGDPMARDDLEQVTLTGFGPINADTPMLAGAEERYSLQVVVSLLGPDSDADELEERAETIVTTVLDVIADNQRLNGTVIAAVRGNVETAGAIPTGDGGTVIGVDIDVDCAALTR